MSDDSRVELSPEGLSKIESQLTAIQKEMDGIATEVDRVVVYLPKTAWGNLQPISGEVDTAFRNCADAIHNGIKVSAANLGSLGEGVQKSRIAYVENDDAGARSVSRTALPPRSS
jgi:hypothetical protein